MAGRIEALKIEHSAISKELARFRPCHAETRCYFCREWAQFVYKKHVAFNAKPQDNTNEGNNTLKAGRYELRLPGQTVKATKEQLRIPLRDMIAKFDQEDGSIENGLTDMIIDACNQWITTPSRSAALTSLFQPLQFDPFEESLFEVDDLTAPARLLDPLVVQRQTVHLPSKEFRLLRDLAGNDLLTDNGGLCEHSRPEWKSPSELDVERDIFNENMDIEIKKALVDLEKALDTAWEPLTTFMAELKRIDKERSKVIGKNTQKDIDAFAEKQAITRFEDYWKDLGFSAKVSPKNKKKPAVDLATVDAAFNDYFDKLVLCTREFYSEFVMQRLKALVRVLKDLWNVVVTAINQITQRMTKFERKPSDNAGICLGLVGSIEDLRSISDIEAVVDKIVEETEANIAEYADDVAWLKKSFKEEGKQDVGGRLDKIAKNKEFKKRIKKAEDRYTRIRQYVRYQLTQKIFPEAEFAKFCLVPVDALMQEGEMLEASAIESEIRRFTKAQAKLADERECLYEDFQDGVCIGRQELGGILGRMFFKEIIRIQGHTMAMERQDTLLKSLGVEGGDEPQKRPLVQEAKKKRARGKKGDENNSNGLVTNHLELLNKLVKDMPDEKPVANGETAKTTKAKSPEPTPTVTQATSKVAKTPVAKAAAAPAKPSTPTPAPVKAAAATPSSSKNATPVPSKATTPAPSKATTPTSSKTVSPAPSKTVTPVSSTASTPVPAKATAKIPGKAAALPPAKTPTPPPVKAVAPPPAKSTAAAAVKAPKPVPVKAPAPTPAATVAPAPIKTAAPAPMKSVAPTPAKPAAPTQAPVLIPTKATSTQPKAVPQPQPVPAMVTPKPKAPEPVAPREDIGGWGTVNAAQMVKGWSSLKEPEEKKPIQPKVSVQKLVDVDDDDDDGWGTPKKNDSSESSTWDAENTASWARVAEKKQVPITTGSEPTSDGWATPSDDGRKEGLEKPAKEVSATSSEDGSNKPSKQPAVDLLAMPPAESGWSEPSKQPAVEALTLPSDDGWNKPVKQPGIGEWAKPQKREQKSDEWNKPPKQPESDEWVRPPKQKTATDTWTPAKQKKEETDGWAAPKEKAANDGWNPTEEQTAGWNPAESEPSNDGWGVKEKKNDGWKSTEKQPSTDGWGVKETQSDGWNSTEKQSSNDGWGVKEKQNDGWNSTEKQSSSDGWNTTKQKADGWGTTETSTNDGWNSSQNKQTDRRGSREKQVSNGQYRQKSATSNNWRQPEAQQQNSSGGWKASENSRSNDSNWRNREQQKLADKWSSAGNSGWGNTTGWNNQNEQKDSRQNYSVPGNGWDSEKQWKGAGSATPVEQDGEVVNFTLKDILAQSSAVQPSGLSNTMATPPAAAPGLAGVSGMTATAGMMAAPGLSGASGMMAAPGLTATSEMNSTIGITNALQTAPQKSMQVDQIRSMSQESLITFVQTLQMDNARLYQTLLATQQEMSMQTNRYKDMMTLSQERENQMLQLFEARKQTDLEETRRYILSLQAQIKTLEQEKAESEAQREANGGLGATAGFGNQDLFAGYRENLNHNQRGGKRYYGGKKPVTRCGNCGDYGHSSAECDDACRYCGSQQHLSESCTMTS